MMLGEMKLKGSMYRDKEPALVGDLTRESLDKGDTQAVANDNVPQEEQDAGTFVERLTARRTERRQVKDLEGGA